MPTILYVGELHNQDRLSSDGFLNIVWSHDVVTLYVEPQFTTVYKRSHIVLIVTMATQMSGPSGQITNCSLTGDIWVVVMATPGTVQPG